MRLYDRLKSFSHNIYAYNKCLKKQARIHDEGLPKYYSQPVYESDEQLRYNLTILIITTGVALVTFAFKNFSKSGLVNVCVAIYGGTIIFLAMFYVAATATRLRYKNPGQAYYWYVSEHGRRLAYDNMVDAFWIGAYISLTLALPFYLITREWPKHKGWAVEIATAWIVAFVLKWMYSSIGIAEDRKSGNLLFNVKTYDPMSTEDDKTADAPPTVRSDGMS